MLTVDTVKPERLLVASAVCTDVPRSSCPTPLPPPDGRADDWKCYKVKLSKGAAKFPKGIRATVRDGLQTARLYDVVKPTRLCTTVARDGEPARRPDAHLMCYQVKLAKTDPPQPKHTRQIGLPVANDLDRELADTLGDEELCVPSAASAATAG